MQLLLKVSGVHDAILSRVGTVDLLLELVLPSEAAFEASWQLFKGSEIVGAPEFWLCIPIHDSLVCDFEYCLHLNLTRQEKVQNQLNLLNFTQIQCTL